MLIFSSSSLILARRDKVYEDMASKFFEHFVYILDAINYGMEQLWDETDGFYYDHILLDGKTVPIKIRSMVGLVSFSFVILLHDK